jgi:hypothetical protein
MDMTAVSGEKCIGLSVICLGFKLPHETCGSMAWHVWELHVKQQNYSVTVNIRRLGWKEPQSCAVAGARGSECSQPGAAAALAR